MDINDLILSEEALSVIDNGEWVEAGDIAPGVEFLVVGFRSEAARKLMKSKQAQARAKNRGKALTEEQTAEITKAVIYECVLKGWRGLKSNGEDLPYSKELAQQFITSRGGEKFFLAVVSAANTLDENANDYVEEITKNSPPASSGKSETPTQEK